MYNRPCFVLHARKCVHTWVGTIIGAQRRFETAHDRSYLQKSTITIRIIQLRGVRIIRIPSGLREHVRYSI